MGQTQNLQPKDPNDSFDLRLAKKLVALKDSADSRKLHFDITLKKLKQLLNTTKCYYTGITFTDKQKFMRTIDRVDNDLGYIDSNVVVCCHFFNSLKANMTVTQIRQMHKGLTRHEKKLKRATLKKPNLKVVKLKSA